MTERPAVKVFDTPMPDEILYKSGHSSQFGWLAQVVLEMPPKGHIEIVFPNQAEAKKSQSNINSGSKAFKHFPFRVITRTSPTNGNKDGQWTLYVQRRLEQTNPAA